MAKDTEINERLEHVDEIIEQVDAEKCDRAKGEDLYEEGQRYLT